MKGTIIGGAFNKILIRQKTNQNIELGELLVSGKNPKILLQAYDLIYGSQLSQNHLELISGMKLEQGSSLEFMDGELRNYNLVVAKNLMALDTNNISKSLPSFFSDVNALSNDDLKFFSLPNNPLFFGNLRSGSNVLEQTINLDAKKVLPEHILITASTGKGKSNLTSCLLWSLIDKDACGILILDPHDEYYGRNKIGLKDFSKNSLDNTTQKNKVVYYSKSPLPGTMSLKINLSKIKPSHFNGVVNWSDAQYEALIAYHRKYKQDWIKAILTEQEINGFHETTLAVIKRRLLNILDLQSFDGKIICQGIFDFDAGETTISDVCHELELANTVIIDTSNLSSNVEVLVGSLISTELFYKYKRYKTTGVLKEKPVISIVIEEAPRVLGKEVLEKGSNIFSTLAREGRKFKVGLIAITQLPSLIPRQILANMNTKIILGMEMGVERRAIIESSAQDLSDDEKNIALLDKGEAIITSNFVKFATPIKMPLFEEMVKKEQNSAKNSQNLNVRNDYTSIGGA
ncbi:ATP-binding protein [Candidatus Woesearchaeota archaeon]|nr:ATP-binding protein [Candidatus Woesearchaeota archaeon]MBT5272711.1 ATP-binding protein [Candidatus Woesearchaeota archaeon]MBT6040322.1 ATP-binding protein [Candidatus Woesearchaeota archaeon]MBT6337044.1 ATP-binding protein [Candidatus Woesearchaeota archaeon]MBT7927902.1 ATP-binding protein [Candidatus Woesearchaeota archaeon]